MAIEIVDFPIENGDLPVRYVNVYQNVGVPEIFRNHPWLSQVWAYHPSRTASTPPASEWNVPHDGPIDNSFSVSMRWAAKGGIKDPKKPGLVSADNKSASKSTRC